jgi:protein gp37
MGKQTNIRWTRSSRNAWTGCRKIGPGCDGCYAEAQNRFYRGKNPETGEANNWGDGARIPHLEGFAKDLRSWNKAAGKERDAGTRWEHAPDMPAGYWPVFVNSQSDTFDNDVPQAWRDFMWPILEECSNLSILLVTKRIGNVARMVPERWMRDGFPENVRLLITVCNQDEADRDIPKLLALPFKNGISYEPALGPVHWGPYLSRDKIFGALPGFKDPMGGVQWIIVGGESNQGSHRAREFYPDWALDTIKQCKAAGVAAFMKQMGSRVIVRNDAGFDGCDPESWPIRPDGCDPELDHAPFGHEENHQGAPVRIRLVDRAGADPAEWPEVFRIGEFPK